MGTSIVNPESSISGRNYMLASVLFFSVGHALVKLVPGIPYYQLAFLRALVTSIICLGLLKIKKISWKGNNLKLLLLRGLAGTIALTSYFYSLQHMPLASAVTIQYLSPLATLLIAHFYLKERAQPSQFLFFGLALLGIFMVKGFDGRVTFGELMISLISVGASAIAYNLVRMLKEYDHELVVVLYFPLVTMPIVGPVAIFSWVPPSLRDWIFIVLIGVLTQIAQMMMTISYHRSKASEVAIFNYIGIFFALGIGYWIFQESFGFEALLGMFVILVSVIGSYVFGRKQMHSR